MRKKQKYTVVATLLISLVVMASMALLIITAIQSEFDSPAAADEKSWYRRDTENAAQYVAQNMVYFKEPQSGLCFGFFQTQVHGGQAVTTSNVPCDKVEHLLINK